MNKYDVIVVGSGLGGLVSGLILAKEGKKVLILEKNQQFGGNLQCFSRDKTLFDTGVHYIGALGEGENLNRFFSYLDIMKDLNIVQMDNHFEKITLSGDTNEYAQVQGYDAFEKYLKRTFPNDHTAINAYLEKMKYCCLSFPLYNLQSIGSYDSDLINLNLKDYLDEITDNETLKAVLVGNNFLYAGHKDVPFYVHALSVNSFILSSWRCENGGAQIAKSLVKRLREHGGDIIKRQCVTAFHIEDDHVVSVETSDGKIYRGENFISNIDPKTTLNLLPENIFRKSYVKRVKESKSGVSCFCLHLVLQPETVEYINHNIYHFENYDAVWDAQQYCEKDWPKSYIVSMAPSKNQGKWSTNMTIMAYMHFDEVKQWKDSFNTVVNPSERSAEYEEFKQTKIELLLEKISEKYPDIRSNIKSMHTSTPLSFRDYIGNFEGTMYGFEKNSEYSMRTIFSNKTKIKNLFLTGQGLNMHGILGVTISGFMTAGQLVGLDHILEQIHENENS